MKFRSIGALAVGAAIGYALNTPTGRAQVARVKKAVAGFMGRPEVQAKTANLAEKAKERTGGLPDPVQNLANTTIDAATHRAAGQSDRNGPSAGGSSDTGTDSGTASSGSGGTGS